MKTLTLVALLLTAGVASAADAKLTTDTFDGATRVSVDPHGLDCGMQMVCPLFGARWTSSRKDEAVLEVEIINAYASIDGVRLNVDGEFLELEPLEQARPTSHSSNVAEVARLPGNVPVSRRSSRDYLVPLALVPKLLAAKSVKVRVSTADGFVDGELSGGKKPSKAYGALQRFMAKVPATNS